MLILCCVWPFLALHVVCSRQRSLSWNFVWNEIPLLIKFHVFPPLSLSPSVCSIHSWRWPSLCPASPRSSWQPRTPWGATAKSQSLKTISANAIDSQTSHHHLTGLRMTTISDLLEESQTASPLFSSVSVLMPDVSPLCLVLKLHTAMMCFSISCSQSTCLCVVDVDTGCYRMHYQECGIPAAKVQDSSHTKGHKKQMILSQLWELPVQQLWLNKRGTPNVAID